MSTITEQKKNSKSKKNYLFPFERFPKKIFL